MRDGDRSDSLLGVLDRTATPMGARLLQDWLLTPLAERAGIEARLDAVTELLGEHALRGDLRQALGEAFDLQRLTARVSTGRASPRASPRSTLRVRIRMTDDRSPDRR